MLSSLLDMRGRGLTVLNLHVSPQIPLLSFHCAHHFPYRDLLVVIHNIHEPCARSALNGMPLRISMQKRGTCIRTPPSTLQPSSAALTVHQNPGKRLHSQPEALMSPLLFFLLPSIYFVIHLQYILIKYCVYRHGN
jgi:hypothetical protein